MATGKKLIYIHIFIAEKYDRIIHKKTFNYKNILHLNTILQGNEMEIQDQEEKQDHYKKDLKVKTIKKIPRDPTQLLGLPKPLPVAFPYSLP